MIPSLPHFAPPFSDSDFFNFDHLGIVVNHIDNFWETSLFKLFPNIQIESKLYDPLQQVWVQFLKIPGLTIELLEAGSVNSPISSNLKMDALRLHHLCFKVPNMVKALELAEATGCILIKPPLPAVAFNSSPIAFVMGKDRLLLEFVEAI